MVRVLVTAEVTADSVEEVAQMLREGEVKGVVDGTYEVIDW